MTKRTLRLKVWQAILLCCVLIPIAVVVLTPSLGYLALGCVTSLWDQELADAYYARSAQRGGPGAMESSLLRLENASGSLFRYAETVRVEMGGAMGTGAYMTAPSLDQLEKEYGVIAARSRSDSAFAAYTVQVAMANFFSGRTDRALALLESVSDVPDARLRELVALHRAAMLVCSGRGDEAEAILDGGGFSSYGDVAGFIRTFLCLLQGDSDGWNQAIWKEDRAPTLDIQNIAPRYRALVEPFFGFYEVQSNHYEELTALRNDGRPTGNRLEGRILREGDGMPFFVSLVPRRNGASFSTNRLFSNEAAAAAMTGADGRFVITNIPDGEYCLSVSGYVPSMARASLVLEEGRTFTFTGGSTTLTCPGIRLTPLEVSASVMLEGDQLVMAAENVPPAASYQLRLKQRQRIQSGSFTTELYLAEPGGALRVPVPLDRLEATLPINCAPEYPSSYLPGLRGEQRLVVEVRGFDSTGNLLFSTGEMADAGRYEDACCASAVDFGGLSAADRLLLEGRYDEAIPLYEADAAAGDDHAHLALYALFHEGYLPRSAREDGGGIQDEAPGGRDEARAASHLEAVLQNHPGDPELILALGQSRMDAGQNQEALAVLLQAEPENGYPTREIGTLYWRLGQPDKALALWKRSIEEERFLPHSDDILARAAMALGDKEHLPALARDVSMAWNSESLQAAAERYLTEDLSGYQPFFKLVRAGRNGEALALLEEDDSPLGILLRLTLISLDRPAIFPAEVPQAMELLPEDSPYRQFLSGFYN